MSGALFSIQSLKNYAKTPILKTQQRSRLPPTFSKPQALPDLCIGCHMGFLDIPPGSQTRKRYMSVIPCEIWPPLHHQGAAICSCFPAANVAPHAFARSARARLSLQGARSMDLRPFCVGLRKRMHALRTLGCLLFSSIWLAACGDGETAPVKPDETEQPSERQDVPEVTEIPETCNGYEELCERRFDEVTFPGTHNSMSVAEEKWGAPNQQYSIERQLEDGIRVMMLDVYFQENELKLCHSICLFGERPLD